MTMTSIHVADIMTREVFAVTPETSLVTTARLFANRHISGAPVVDRTGRVIGVVTQTDLVDPDRDRSDRLGTPLFYRLVGDARLAFRDDAMSPDGVVGDVMSPFVLSIGSNATLQAAVRLMVADDVHRLLVIDDGKLVGMISTMDVLRALALRTGLLDTRQAAR